MKRISHLLSAIALAIPLAAQATLSFTIDPDGAAGGAAAVLVDSFDMKPGTALSIKGNPVGGLSTGDVTQLLYQANMGTFDLGGSTQVVSGQGGSKFFTVVAGFEEFATVSGNTASFQLANGVTAPTAKNFFYIYANSANGNNLAGTGFATGTLVLSGYISGVTSSAFTIDPTKGLATLDGFAGDSWGGTKTVVGSGTTDLQITISNVDANYFPDLKPTTEVEIGFVNNSQVDPFKQADPSFKMSSNGLANGDYASNVGPVNGFNTSTTSTYDFIFQADGNGSLEVPEPGSLALVGLALGAAGMVARRRKA